MWKMPSQAPIWDRKAFPSPWPEWAPFTRPAMSTTLRNAGTLLQTRKKKTKIFETQEVFWDVYNMIHLHAYEDNSPKTLFCLFGSSKTSWCFYFNATVGTLSIWVGIVGKKYNDSNKTQLKKARNKPKPVPYNWHSRDRLIIILSPAPEHHTTMSNWVFVGVFVHI